MKNYLGFGKYVAITLLWAFTLSMLFTACSDDEENTPNVVGNWQTQINISNEKGILMLKFKNNKKLQMIGASISSNRTAFDEIDYTYDSSNKKLTIINYSSRKGKFMEDFNGVFNVSFEGDNMKLQNDNLSITASRVALDSQALLTANEWKLEYSDGSGIIYHFKRDETYTMRTYSENSDDYLENGSYKYDADEGSLVITPSSGDQNNTFKYYGVSFIGNSLVMFWNDYYGDSYSDKYMKIQ